MTEKTEKMTIPAGTMINLSSRHIDDEPLIAEQDLQAEIVPEGTTDDVIQVIIPEIDSDKVFYIYRPTVSKE